MTVNSYRAMSADHSYFKSAFSVDCVIFGFDEADLKVLLIKTDKEPYLGYWSLVGDLVHPDEDLDEAAARVLKDRTGLENVFLEQVETFGKVNRHPNGRVITIAYYSLIKIQDYELATENLNNEASWHNIDDLDQLAYDHTEILASCRQRLKSKVRHQPIGFELLPPKFTLTELQHLYQAVLGEKLDKRNFRKKVLNMGILEELGEYQTGVAHRPAKLFKFDPERYQEAKAKGLVF
ncbi:MAG: NUDIX domain-containing protein, partial [Bacteroidota bacterium]